MFKIPISGGPHTGKSTLLEALPFEYPEAYFVPESATKIIQQEMAKRKEDPDYVPMVPWIAARRREFDMAAVDEYIKQEASLPDGDGLAFQDRCIYDSVFYSAHGGSADLVPEIERKARAANYAFALFCEPVGTYTQTAERKEVPEEAHLIHEGLREVYANSGLRVVTLPNVSVDERLTIVRNTLAEFV